MSVLLTGVAGFIGSHVAERLLGMGTDVVGLDSFDDFYDPAVKERNLEVARDHLRFTEMRGDLRDPDFLEEIPADVDAVIHLAARAGVRPSIQEPELYFDVNVRGTLLLLEEMRRRGVDRLVFGSSSSVYGNSATAPFSEEDPVPRPISPYAATKRTGELMVHTWHHLYGLSAMCLRLFTVYGPRQRPDLAIHKFARLMAAGEPLPMFGDGASRRDYTYVDDIVSGIVSALQFVEDHRGCYEIANLGGNRTVSLARMVEVLAATLGVEPRISSLPCQPGDVRRTWADLTRAQSLLGFEPLVSFEEGIRRFAQWFADARELSLVSGVR
jgi:UDP-glucuronate 4-epimerase